MNIDIANLHTSPIKEIYQIQNPEFEQFKNLILLTHKKSVGGVMSIMAIQKMQKNTIQNVISAKEKRYNPHILKIQTDY